jgi:hypothetical protein
MHSTPSVARRERVTCTTGYPLPVHSKRPFVHFLNWALWIWQRAYGTFRQVFSPRVLESSYLEFLWPYSTSESWMAVLLKHKDPHVDLEISYAHGRRVYNYPSKKFGVRICLKSQDRLATAHNNLLGLQLVRASLTISLLAGTSLSHSELRSNPWMWFLNAWRLLQVCIQPLTSFVHCLSYGCMYRSLVPSRTVSTSTYVYYTNSTSNDANPQGILTVHIRISWTFWGCNKEHSSDVLSLLLESRFQWNNLAVFKIFWIERRGPEASSRNIRLNTAN